jgi:hypothetical protein
MTRGARSGIDKGIFAVEFTPIAVKNTAIRDDDVSKPPGGEDLAPNAPVEKWERLLTGSG